MTDGRADRLAVACQAAMNRLLASESQVTTSAPDIFAELGEALFWLEALAELNRRQAAVLQGLRWARHRIAHGALVSAPSEWREGFEPLRIPGLPTSVLETFSHHVFVESSRIPLGPRDKPSPALQRAYDGHVAGRPVYNTLLKRLQRAR